MVGKLLELARPVSLDNTMNPHLRSEEKKEQRKSAGVLETPTRLDTKDFLVVQDCKVHHCFGSCS